MKQKVVITKSSEETKKLGREFFIKFHLNQGGTLALYGELGSGKTTFVQGLAEGLGIKQRIISPTFIIVRSYKLSFARPGLGRLKNFYHIDLYRIEGKKELEGLGFEEILNEPNTIVVIEWAEKMENLLPKNRIDIHFEHVSENERKIIITQLT